MAVLPDVWTLVADWRGEAVGFAMLSREEPAELELVAIAVRPDWESRGVGRLLLDSAERAAIERAAATLRLTVALDNPRARRLFERAGYTYVQEEQGQYAGGQSSIGMRKRLGS
jgi:ribosomal-protein-alanine N-acetyltransferase